MKRARSLLSVITAGALAFGTLYSGLVGSAAPAHADDSASTSQILPTPQSVAASATPVALSGTVAVTGTGMADAATAESIQELVRAAGGTIATDDAAAQVIIGTLGDPAVADALKKANVENSSALVANGYVLTTALIDGVPTVIIEGKDAAGTYYGTQTARQMLNGGSLTGTVRDWPSMPIRGVIEGFYGQPWSHQARLDMLEFSAKHKMNTYIYTPKDDRYLRAQWRAPYPDAELAKIRELVDQANRYHLDFVFAISPGNDICYSKQEDYTATINKFEQLRSIGVHSFYVALDDISPYLKCQEDFAAFPSRGPWTQLADAQSYYLNKIQKEWIVPNKLNPLMMVPTNYNGSARDPFKTAQGERLDKDIRMQWTGEGVFSKEVTRSSVDSALVTYNTHHMFIWDNFPVNDGDRNRLFLQPLFGRDQTLHEVLDGFTSNPMIQPYASWIALQGFADYTWNTPGFKADSSQEAILRELAGTDPKVHETLDAFVDLNQYWESHDPDSKRAPKLSVDLAEYEKHLGTDGVISNTASLTTAKQQLAKRLEVIRQAPETLKKMAVPGFYNDAEPWIRAAAEWAEASLKALDVREAAQCTDMKAAAEAYASMRQHVNTARQPAVDDMDSNFVLKEKSIIPKVGDGKFDEMVDGAKSSLEKLLDLKAVDLGAAPTVKSDFGHYDKYVPENMLDGNTETMYWSNASPDVGQGVQVDLQATKSVSAIVLHQGKSDTDTGGDVVTSMKVKSSIDGQKWDEIGTYNDLAKVEIKLDQPKEMRYVRFESAVKSNKWWQIREIIFAISGGMPMTTDLPLQVGAEAPMAFDANLNTAMLATGVPEKGGHLTYTPTSAQDAKAAVLLGTAKGKAQIKQGSGEWTDLGTVSADSPFFAWPITGGNVTGLRLLVDPDSPAPSITEFGLRSEALPQAKCAPISVAPVQPEPPSYAPKITGPSDPVAVKTPVTITGTGFAADEDIDFVIMIPRANDASGATDPFPIGKWPADEKGDVTFTFTVPGDLAPGTYTIQALGTTSKAPATTQLTVKGADVVPPAPTINPSLDVPAQASPGQAIAVSGSGFAPNQQLVLRLTPMTNPDNSAQPAKPAFSQTLTASADGTFRVNLPLDAALALGLYRVEVTGTSPDVVVAKPLKLVAPEAKPAPGLSHTGASVLFVAIFAAMLIAGGAVLTLRASRQK
ncbi:beta-N-acetylglucosaminidase domain-containing protein [Trueperella sp. LYQ143]|uniref:beta-N-acetylglucosaminidase domain-containing protein n=1 Tax=Trueperella sp. LYQ143 TaxID=3391059 RepID=UPI003983C88A